MTAVAASLAQANEILTKSGANQGVNYLVTELELSVQYSEVQLEGKEVLVELGQAEPGPETHRFLRFKVLPLPDTLQREQPGAAPVVPNLKHARLDSSLLALRNAGISLDNVLLKFDPKAEAPEGSVARYEVKTRPTGQIEEIVLTIAGYSPDAPPDKPEPKPPVAGPKPPRPRNKE
jgi:hypothetical protein